MTNDTTNCPRCQSTNLIRITGADESTSQYGRLQCGDCGKFITWLRDPSTDVTTIQRQTAIKNLLDNHKSKLRQEDIRFLTSMLTHRYLTPRQRDYVNSLSRKCLGIDICMSDALHQVGLDG
jgi:hypothetical protein